MNTFPVCKGKNVFDDGQKAGHPNTQQPPDVLYHLYLKNQIVNFTISVLKNAP